MAEAVVQRVDVFPLMIPLRTPVAHAAAARRVADPVLVSVELTNGILGFGETVPREYVTGESVDSVLEAVRQDFVPLLKRFHARSFPEALEAIEELPWCDSAERPFPAARAAVELGLLDASLRCFRRGLSDVVQWMGLWEFGAPGSLPSVRFSGVLASDDVARTRRQLRLMYWAGLRDFKLKVGTPGDQERLQSVSVYLRRSLRANRATLRLDANGCWTLDAAMEWLSQAAGLGVRAVEQPLAKGEEGDLPALRKAVGLPLIHDESLVMMEDALRLVELGVADVFNIRISKCGGLLPALRLAAMARRSGVRIQLGCMVGETSLLAAAALRFLDVCPGVSWAEGCFGRRLLEDDIVRWDLRFGYGGRPPRLEGTGLGIEIDPKAVAALCDRTPITFRF